MKQLIIIGAGGMGRTFNDMVKECHGYGETFILKGYIDDDMHQLDSFENYPPMVGTIQDYVPQENDVFTCSIGGTSRYKCMQIIQQKGGVFINLIHNTALIGTNVVMGTGNVVNAFSTIAADVHIGNDNFIQRYVTVGHDVCIGNSNRIDSYVMCVGGVIIHNRIMIHTSSVINHGVVIQDDSHVGACSFVIQEVQQGTTVIGNPARRWS
ncbi:sialic acid O-acetyltransferase [Gammaproteobacteria bacterium]|nr:sialic acid O-acetyltransferase [Gammaproteobacteria bacterium]